MTLDEAVNQLHDVARAVEKEIGSGLLSEDIRKCADRLHKLTKYSYNMVTEPKSWIVTLEEDPESGDLILPFTDEILAEVGWKEGDVLEWIDNKNGSWSLVKQADKKDK